MSHLKRMKIIKALITLVTLFIATTCFGGNIIEVWQKKNVRYTFVDDSLYVDELGDEGDCYTYELVDNCLYLTDELGDANIKIVIHKKTKKHVWILVYTCDFNTERPKIIKYKRYGYYR